MDADVPARYRAYCFHILARHIPGGAVAVSVLMRFDAAQTNAFALAQRVKAEADMLADNFAVCSFHWPRLVRQITIQEFTEGTLSDKADAGGIFLCCIG